jgi:molecular chaperone HtpG
MANFGVCSKLEITTRKETERESTVCFAERSNLSASKECVFYSAGTADAPRGTTIRATVSEPVSPDAAANYLTPIVQYVDFPVNLNGRLLSQQPFPSVAREGAEFISVSEGPVTLTLSVLADRQGRAEASIQQLQWNGTTIEGARGFFSLTGGSVSSYQHGFMLARVPVSTIFSVGGIFDCPLLRPTAGREALMSESQTLVQQCLTAVDHALADFVASKPDLADQFSQLFHYIVSRGRWELGSLATIRVYGAGTRVTLASVRAEATSKEVYYCGERHDRAIMETFRTQGKLIVQLSNESRRQTVEQNYLNKYCRARQLEDRVTCLKIMEEMTLGFQEYGFIYKLKQRLRNQYFIESISIKAGSLTHGAMLLSPPKSQGTGMVLVVDLSHSNVQRLMNAGTSLAADAVFDMFVRDSVFPHLESAFPELRSRDFDLLLRRLQSTVEYFQVDPNDIERLNLLAEVTNMPRDEVAAVVASGSIGRPSAASVGRAEVVSVAQVVQTPSGGSTSEAELARVRDEFLARLLTTSIKAKVLDATGVQPGLGVSGYYLALTADAHILYRRVLERRPSADFTWGGYRAGFVFYQEGQGVLYYDVELSDLVIPQGGGTPGERGGTVRLQRQPLLAQDMVFIPVPESFERYFVPQDATLRFTIRHQILGLGSARVSLSNS